MITEIETKQEILAPSAIEAISAAEINSAIATARRFPRQLSVVKKNMLSFATLDQETAESCFYSLPRGGKNIQGPSVRLAEIALSCYGNIRAGSRIIQTVTDGPNPHVVVQAVCMDLENNVSVSIEKRRRIIGKKSAGGAISDDDIQLAGNAGASIAFRDSVFKVVPLALIKPVYEQAKKVAIGDAKTLGDRRMACIAHFAKMGITQDKVLAKLEVKAIDDVTLEHVEILLGLHNAIKDGELSLDDAFATAAPTAKPKFVKPATKTDDGDLAPQTTPAVTEPPPAAPVESPVAITEPAPATGEIPELVTLRASLATLGVTEAQVVAVCQKKNIAKGSSLVSMDARTLTNLNKVLTAPNSSLLKEAKEVV